MAAVRIISLDPERDQHRRLVGLPRRRRDRLRQMQRAIARRRVAGDPRGDPRRARLSIPQAELGEVDARALLDRLDEILARRSLAVVALEIEVGAFAEPLDRKSVVEGKWV